MAFVKRAFAPGLYLTVVLGGVAGGLLILAGVISWPPWAGAVLLGAGIAVVVVPIATLALLRPVRQPPMTFGDVVGELLSNLFGFWW